MTSETWDLISQIGIPLFGAAAIFLIARKNRWGFVLGLCSQPFWMTTAVLNEQWGILVISLLYTVNWCYGIYNWFFKNSTSKQ